MWSVMTKIYLENVLTYTSNSCSFRQSVTISGFLIKLVNEKVYIGAMYWTTTSAGERSTILFTKWETSKSLLIVDGYTSAQISNSRFYSIERLDKILRTKNTRHQRTEFHRSKSVDRENPLLSRPKTNNVHLSTRR